MAGILGDTDRAVELLAQAYDAGLGRSVWDHRHPACEAVRSDPSFQAFFEPRR